MVYFEGVLNNGSVYTSKVFGGPGKDVVVVMQEVDELALSFLIQHSGDDDLLASVTFEQEYFLGFFCWPSPGLLFWFLGRRLLEFWLLSIEVVYIFLSWGGCFLCYSCEVLIAINGDDSISGG